jgi:hypothetical protein
MSTEQTPALDIWSAGITFLSLFCRKHPIFRPNDDYEALVQLGVIFGTQNFVDFAAERGISLLFPRKHPGVDLVKFVKAMRGGAKKLTHVLTSKFEFLALKNQILKLKIVQN